MKKPCLFLVALGIAATFQGCDNQGSQPANTATGKKFHLAFVTNTKNDFWSIVHRGCENAALNLGNVELDFRFLTNSTVEAQEEIMSALVAGGADGIAISPIDGEKEADFLNQIAAKTLLVCVDSDAANSKRVCFIGTDNVAAGKQAAELIKAALPQGGKIALFVGYPNAENAKERIQGLQSGLDGSNVQIIDTLADATKTDIAQKNAQDAMAKYPDLAGMVGLYSYNGPAILTAARAAGKAGKVKIVCFDDDSLTLDGISDGDIYGTVVQISTRIGSETITRMDRYLMGDKTQLSEGKILFNSIVVNTNKVDMIRAWRQDLLQP